MAAMKKAYEKYIGKLDVPHDKTIVITGGNSGIGFSVAKELLPFDWKIILAVRSLERGERAKADLLKIKEDADISVYELDVSSPTSIEAFARRLQEEKLDVDVFYCNAGVYRIPLSFNEEGLETTAATNFVGNYLLYEKLKGYFHTLPHEVRLILTSSITARFEKWNYEDFFGNKKYHKAKAYGRSKVGVNCLFRHIVDEEKGTNILPLLVHPGITYTPLINKAYKGKRFQLAANRFVRLFFHPVDKAAISTLYLLQPKIKDPCFCGPRGPFHISGYPTTYRLYAGNTKQYKEIVSSIESAREANNDHK